MTQKNALFIANSAFFHFIYLANRSRSLVLVHFQLLIDKDMKQKTSDNQNYSTCCVEIVVKQVTHCRDACCKNLKNSSYDYEQNTKVLFHCIICFLLLLNSSLFCRQPSAIHISNAN